MSTAVWPREEKQEGYFFVEPWDIPQIPYDAHGNIDFDQWLNMPEIERPLLPVIQPDPPRLTRAHFRKPYGGWDWRRVEHLIGPNFWADTTVREGWYGLTSLKSYREEGDYVTLRFSFGQESRYHKYAWIECP